LRKKNQELEKFKFVLDYKITELKRQMKPRKEQMDQLDEQIAQMQAELNGYMKQSVHLNLQVRELNLKLDGIIFIHSLSTLDPATQRATERPTCNLFEWYK
jgi:chromosome segregation ATPase